MSRLALVTCRNSTLYAQESDDQLLQVVLQEAGVTADLVAWDDPLYDWTRPDLVLIRSVWDYPTHYDAFLSWVRAVASKTTLCNTAPLVCWNAQKTYLRDLEEQGIPCIPTQWLPAQTQGRLLSLMQSTGWKQVVIKPALDTGGKQARIIAPHAITTGQAYLETVLQTGTVMVQPFLSSFYSVGERCLIFINGTFTHAVRRRFSLLEGLKQVGLISVTVTEEELTFAQRVLDHLPIPPLCARIDLVRDPQQRLLLNEVELIEPVLYLTQNTQALHLLRDACIERLRQATEQRLRESQKQAYNFAMSLMQ